MKILVLSVILALGLLQAAQAMEVTFNFNVYSSGADIYPCNAGIYHQNGGNHACHLVNSTTACAVGSVGCVCTAGGAAQSRRDFVSAAVTNWDLTGTPVNVSAQAISSPVIYDTLITDGTDFDHRLTNLTFNLGSENYGSSYWVDVCYRGPQIDYWANDVGVKMTLDAQMTMTDLAGIAGSNANYIQASGLQSLGAIVCDLQGMGNHKYAANGGVYDTTATDVFINQNGGMFADVGNNFGGFGNASAGLTSFAQGYVISNTLAGPTGNFVPNNAVPRFCKVRYFLNEQNISTQRLWNIHGATVQTFTRIQAN